VTSEVNAATDISTTITAILAVDSTTF